MKKILLSLLIIIFVSGCTQLDLDIPSFSSSNENSFTANGDMLVAHFIDVGQGDANFIELPNGETMLIDAGIQSSGDDIIEYIENLGYTNIDYVVSTHPHADHIGGMALVIEAFNVENIYMPKAVSTSKTYENLLETIQNRGLSIKTGRAGVEILNTDDLNIILLAPTKESYNNLNNYSIVLKITYGDVSFLYTGDAEEESLDEITGDLKADVLKVGHHGSNTSTTKSFLEKVKPEYAIISVGAKNSYGHPNSSTLELLEEYTNNIYRTDINGTVIIRSDGVNIEVEKER